MKNYLLSASLLFVLLFPACQQTPPKSPVVDDAIEQQAIKDLLSKQAVKWSNYDIDGFMEDYWKSDSLKFYGSSGITYGWEQTLANYHKRYPSAEHTGVLNFKIISMTKAADDVYMVMGEYHLTRTVGDASGPFSILLKKINGKWKIIADHTC